MTDAASIAKALDGVRNGGEWVCHCPVPGHGKGRGDHNPSLSIRNGDQRLLVHCFAGCDVRDVLNELGRRGLHEDGRHRRHDFHEDRRRRRQDDRQVDRLGDRRRQVEKSVEPNLAALALWQASQPISGTPAEHYLVERRGLTAPFPPALRFHPRLKHPSGVMTPAMIALVTYGTDNKPVAIHRTFLACDGGGKAPVEPQKMMLGPCRCGAVRLAAPGGLLMVGEGIETCLAAMQATGHPAWAALSTSGLRALDLPEGVSDVIVLADGDDPGEAAAQDCARRWKREGRHVRIARPPKGVDFNDLLLGPAPRLVASAP